MNAAQRLGLRETVITLGVALVLAAVLIGLTPTVLAQSQSNDATLSGLTLNGVDFGTFASGTITYTASVDSGVTETTVTPTPNHSGSSYVIKRGGETDEDGEIALSAGSNVITVEVTAEDGQTTKTYSVTVTRPVSTNAYLRALTLSGIVLEHDISLPPRIQPPSLQLYSQCCLQPDGNDRYANSQPLGRELWHQAKLKPRWEVHLGGVGNRGGSLVGGFRPLIAGWYGTSVWPHPPGWPTQRGSR